MAFFTAIGTISNDIVRRETKNGVVATFRLETGAPRGRKLWIDVDCWGHLAGSVGRFGARGRMVSVSGRLLEKTWRDKTSGDRRVRINVRAYDLEFVSAVETGELLANHVQAAGRLLNDVTFSEVRGRAVAEFTIRSGRSGSKVGRLDLPCETWADAIASEYPPGPSSDAIAAGSLVHCSGGKLALRLTPPGSLVLTQDRRRTRRTAPA